MSKGINAKPPAANRREIRVFISSTFRDMQEEREELVKQVFPQLRRLCESRGVTWGEVDLRWGVPDEAKAEGKVLPLCLQEIEHCRPYFIGLLGERYGWVPEDFSLDLVESQPWLEKHRGKSVTALEILHGVLENPEMAEHAFFYFRDLAYAAAHPGFTEEDPALREKLAKLKDDIRHSGFPVSEPFISPKQLGEWVLRDLTAVIEQIYPEANIPNALERAALDHEAYSASRRTVYMGRQEYMDRLDAHAAGDGPPLVITGESGGGKSALLANWTHTWSELHPETPVLVHFIGAAPDSADWMAMLRRLLGEFQRKFGIQIQIPDKPDALRSAFANALHMVAARGRLVLVLDALNQIEDRDGAPDLVWLPPVIPDNVRLVVSTLPGRPWDDLKKRGWLVLTVEPLTVPEREELIVRYLKRYSKALSPEPAHRIAAAPQTGNGLYLSTLLNELRQFGSYERLNERIDWYLQAANSVELYGKVIQRWEQDYGNPDPACENIVRESLTHLWAARRGLSETELLGSLRTPSSPIPRALWSPVYLAAGDAFVNRGGLLSLSHSYFREAVERRHLQTSESKRAAHERLALYFEFAPIPARSDARLSVSLIHSAIATSRYLDEEPWQLHAASRWDTLTQCLSFLPVFEAACSTGREFEWMMYWQSVKSAAMDGAARPVDIPRLYLGSFHLLNEVEKGRLAGTLGQFLYELDYFDAALECFAEEERLETLAGNTFLRAIRLNDKGLIERDREHHKEALELFDEAASILESVGSCNPGIGSEEPERRLLASVLMNKISVMRADRDATACKSVLQRALELMVETTGVRSPEVATVLQSLGNLAIEERDFKAALDLHLQAHAIRRENLGPDHRDVALSIGSVANTLAGMDHYHYAMCLWERSLSILNRTVGEDHHFSRVVSTSLSQCKHFADKAVKNVSWAGIVLLVFNSLPSHESSPDPTTGEGAQALTQEISDNLIEIWDDSVAHGNSFPVLVISCPGYESAMARALEEGIANRYPAGLLTSSNIPAISKGSASPAELIPLLSVKKQFLNWIQDHNLEVVMVKPIMNSGATFDQHFLGFVRKSWQGGANGPSEARPKGSNNADVDCRPLAIEVVPFDQRDGPILGLHTGDGDPRPCVLPTFQWRQQKYSPESSDLRATGVVYVNLSAIRWWSRKRAGIRWWSRVLAGAGLSPLEEWSTRPLVSMATAPWEGQSQVFELALSELTLLIWSRSINCPAERGIRGCVPRSPNREVERLLI
jgi:tetratricopeptide (TPR) repeat protein